MSNDDHRSNSAWNQRWIVSHRGNMIALLIDDAKAEEDNAFDSSKIDPHNKSPQRSFIGVSSEQHKRIADETSDFFKLKSSFDFNQLHFHASVHHMH